MTLRFHSRVAKRSTLPLTTADVAALAQLRAQRGALAKLGLPTDPSDALLLHTVFAIGLRIAEDEALTAGYEALAVSNGGDPETVQAAEAKRSRKRFRVEEPYREDDPVHHGTPQAGE